MMFSDLFGALFGSILTTPFRTIRWIVGTLFRFPIFLVQTWWNSNQFWNLLKGFPAIVAIVVSGIIFASVHSEHASGRIYLQEARSALRQHDYERAEIFYDRAAELEFERPDIVFEIAQLAYLTEDHNRAEMLFTSIAPIESRGYPDAHLYRAKQILVEATDFDQLAIAETHLIHATSGDNLPEAEAILGKLYLQTIEYEKAVRHLERACETNPEYSLALARACALAGDQAEAEQHGQVAIRYFEMLSGAEPTNLKLRFNWAEACSFLLRFEEAVKILQRGISLGNDETQVRRAIGQVYLAWFDHLEQQSPIDLTQQFKVMAEGLKANPGEVNFLQRAMTIIRRSGSEAKNTKTLMEEMIVSGDGAALGHLVLGTMAIEQEEPQLAIKHLEQAIKLDAGMGFAANNLAWTLAHQETPQLERALKLADTLIGRWPSYAAYRDTRGQILVKLERWEEALEDLRAALPEYSNYRPTHEALALVYQNLGLQELAAEHQRVANSLPFEPGYPTEK